MGNFNRGSHTRTCGQYDGALRTYGPLTAAELAEHLRVPVSVAEHDLGKMLELDIFSVRGDGRYERKMWRD